MKKTIKHLTSLCLVLVMCLSICAPAFAANDSECANNHEPEAIVNIVNHSKHITSQQISEITQSSGAYIVNSDGSITPVEATVIIEDMSTPVSLCGYSANTTNNPSYKVTINAKVDGVDKVSSDSDDLNKAGITATATLEMVWTDCPGTENIIKTVSGALKVYKGTVTSGTVEWGDGFRSAVGYVTRDVGSRRSFSFTANKTALTPCARYYVKFAETQSSELYLKATASIWQ